MKKINLNEAKKVIGGKWEINCYAPSHSATDVRGGTWTIYSNEKKMNNKKASKACGTGFLASSYRKI